MGLLAGYGPLWLDNFLLFFFDTIYSFPTIMLALAIVTVVGHSLNTVIFIIVITSIPVYGRIVRTQTLANRNKENIFKRKKQWMQECFEFWESISCPISSVPY